MALIIVSCGQTPTEDKEFEGVVIYKVEVVSKTPHATTETIQQFYGDKLTYYYKDGKYKMVYNGPLSPTIYYISKDNMQYTVQPQQDTLWSTDCSNEPLKLVSSTLLDKTEKILNTDCKVFENKLEGGLTYTYYFDPDRFINPTNFKDHQLGYVNTFYKKAKGLILKYQRQGISFDLTQTVMEIKLQDLDDKVFELPDLPKKKME